MPYLIDGHNLIGQLPDIHLDDPNDEALLVQKLSGFATRSGKRCVVVFDTGLPAGKSRMSTSRVEVVFASNRSNADKVILERIRKMRDARNWTVISSDRVVQDAARRQGMTVIPSGDFARLMRPADKNADEDDKRGNETVSPDELDDWLRLFGGES